MAFINYATKTIAIKVVYYGPGLSGKTTNLRYVYYKLDPVSRGEFICLETPMERTFFFDLLPVKAGRIGQFKIHFQLITVPGQVFYEASRKSVLKGVDGLVFVADSQIPLLDANLESFDGMRNNLLEYDIDLNIIPLVLQYNKRDLERIIPVETFNNLLNPKKAPHIESSALYGIGVIETLKEISKITVPVIRKKLFEKKDEKEKKKRDDEKSVKEKDMEQDEIEFKSAKKTEPIQLTKIQMESHKDVEKKINDLIESYTEKDDKED